MNSHNLMHSLMILINFHRLNHYDYNRIFRMPDEKLKFAR